MYRKIEVIKAPRQPHYVGDGFRVQNFIPGDADVGMERMNPFILLDYNPPFHFPPAKRPKGVGVHPHRGFETVTIAYQGKVEHHDSNGGGGVIEEGDVQWMTAASGVLHKEYHEKEWSKKGGVFQMVQLWVNLPAKFKMSTPKYQSIQNASIPKVEIANKGGIVEVIAGQYKGTKSRVETFSPLHLWNTKLNHDVEIEFDLPVNYNTAIVIIEGEVLINKKQKLSKDHFALFANENGQINIQAKQKSTILVLSGEPINEPIAAYGPFVMNTQEEIVQAMQDYQNGKFGQLAKN